MDIPSGGSWATRNPQKTVQPSWIRDKLTNAEKATQKIKIHVNHKKNLLLLADLEQYKGDSDQKLAELAENHSCKVECLTHLLHTSPVFKKYCKPNIHNAIMHMKAREQNSG